MKTLLVLCTHFIDEAVISEYRKMQNTPNVDAVLMIDNTNLKMDFKNRIEDKVFFGTTCKCFFFDSALHDEMQLPYFTLDDKKDFAGVMWHNGDYRFYYLRKNFLAYDYYWIMEYDVFCNAETYEGFLKKFTDNRSDLIVKGFRAENKNDSWCWSYGLDWIYKNIEIFGSLFAVVRLSARAIDFLYHKRLEQEKIFQNFALQDQQWVFCEVFVPTELINGGFICENLNEEHVTFSPHIYLNDERIFLQPDNHLYHPVKSVKAEISKLEKQYADLFFAFKKLFFSQFLSILYSLSTVNIKNFPIQFDENFDSMVIDLTGDTGGSLRCEVWFLKDTLHKAAFRLMSAVVFEGEYLKYLKAIEQYLDFNKMQSVQIMQSSTSTMLAYSAFTFDNVSQIANVTNILIEMTFTVLQEKNL